MALYTGASFCLIPWIFILSATLPARHLSHHWDLAWVGFDIGMLTALAITGILAYRRSWWVGMAAMSVCTFLLIDAWFDVLTSRSGQQTFEAVLLALFIELPLAAVSFWLAYRVTRQLVDDRA